MNTRDGYEHESLMQSDKRGIRGAVALLLLIPVAAWAGGVVTDCTETALRVAMAGGGTVTFACDGTITLANTITIAASTVLDGSGHQVTISGGGAVQVLNVPAARSLTLIHLTISNGRTSDGTDGEYESLDYATPGGPSAPGGGIYNAGTLTLRDCVVTGNRTGDGGRGYTGSFESHLNSAGGSAGSGGGIYNAGTLTLNNCLVSGNSTGHGGMSGDGDFSPAALGGTGGSGGGIYNTGTLRLDTSTVSNNMTGAGANSPYRGPGADGGSGGGIWSSNRLIANGCTFSANATGAGGAGGNTTSYMAGWGGRGGAGGGVWSSGNVTVHSCTFSGNATGRGGAGGWASGGIDTGGSGGGGGPGGAIWSSGYVTADNCTFSGDSTGAGGEGGGSSGGMSGGGSGGGGGVGGAIWAAGYLSLTNCTLVANSAGLGGAGGAGTFTGSPGPAGYGGGVAASGAAFLLNTIIALNTGSSPDVAGTFNSFGNNLIGTTNGSSGLPSPGDLVGLDPKVGPLANNGGPTLTVALLPGSPAIDAGDPTAAPATDQRGFPRPAGLAPDIGAFEYGSVMPELTVTRSGATGLDIVGSGNSNQPCRLLMSADLSGWTPMATNQFGSDGTALFYETFAAGSACRFYRLVTP